MGKPLIVIAGPTATGKSAAALELAGLINGEIISADSMQVYQHMDIGTAKPTKEELLRVRHHLIDVVRPDVDFNAAQFSCMAGSAIGEIIGRGKIPILAGGTGFYMNALIFQNNFSSNREETNKELRSALQKELEAEGKGSMYEKLRLVDPEYADTTHMNNAKRVIRGLEYFYETGEKFSEYNARNKSNRSSPYDVQMFILNRDRAKLYQAINLRVNKMIEAGLVGEVKGLLNMGYHEGLTSMQGLGYKEVCAYLADACSLEAAIENIKQGTRRFAKRQVTWFKHQNDGVWLDVDNFKDPIKLALQIKDMVGL